MDKFASTETKLDFADVLISPASSEKLLTRKSVNIEFDWLDSTANPIVIANMLSTGTYSIAKLLTQHRVFTFLHKEYTFAEHVENLSTMENKKYIAITSGVQTWDIEKTDAVCEKFNDIALINVDIANVYANVQGILNTVRHYKERFPHIKICVGNIATPELIRELAEAGADIVKVGIGSGAACKTRSEVGVGVPQLSCILDCYDAARKYRLDIISDGGCVTAGDVTKALGAGAKMVMLGGMVSKSEECDNITEIDGKKYVNFYGLGSTKMYNRTKPTEQEYRPNEGRDLLVPVTGSIMDVIKQVQGGIRSALTYVGAEHIDDMYSKTQFIKVNNVINKSLEKYDS